MVHQLFSIHHPFLKNGWIRMDFYNGAVRTFSETCDIEIGHA